MTAVAVAIVGAALAIGPSHHGGFNLTEAHHKAAQHEQQAGLGGRVGACSWRDRHDATCVVRYSNAVVVDGAEAANYLALDLVTRSGPCSNPGPVVSRRNGLTIQKGGHHYGNCFTGPLIAMALPGSLQVVGS